MQLRMKGRRAYGRKRPRRTARLGACGASMRPSCSSGWDGWPAGFEARRALAVDPVRQLGGALHSGVVGSGIGPLAPVPSGLSRHCSLRIALTR